MTRYKNLMLDKTSVSGSVCIGVGAGDRGVAGGGGEGEGGK